MSNKDEVRKRLEEKLTRECGDVFMRALDDPMVIEIMLNPNGELWVDRAGEGMVNTGHIIPPSRGESLLGTCATMLNTEINYNNPILEGEFPLDGSRLEGLFPPLVLAPSFAIRKHATRIFTLDEYVESGALTAAQAEYLKISVVARKNIVVVGGTGSGKTTLGNALLDALSDLCPNDRIVLIEDTRELQVNVKNKVAIKTSENVDMQRALRATMRYRPDRIIVGEVRGKEALALLKAWNTGHPGGIATLHANSALGGLIRLEELIAENDMKPSPRMISEAVDVLVYIERIKEAPGRKVMEIVEVTGYGDDQYQLKPIGE